MVPPYNVNQKLKSIIVSYNVDTTMLIKHVKSLYPITCIPQFYDLRYLQYVIKTKDSGKSSTLNNE